MTLTDILGFLDEGYYITNDSVSTATSTEAPAHGAYPAVGCYQSGSSTSTTYMPIFGVAGSPYQLILQIDKVDTKDHIDTIHVDTYYITRCTDDVIPL